MSQAIEGLKPELIWKYFAKIASIPHPSKYETALAQYVLDTAKQLGLETQTDAVGNVVVRKPASSGRENVPSVALQGHLDMVPEKNNDKTHDFLKDPIELVRKDNVIMANGTTLGADNGIAIAAFLAIMEDTSLEHGPLEFLFTVDEETGLTGANGLASDLLKSKTLLNLDSEEEGTFFVGCAGGRNTLIDLKTEFDKPGDKYVPMWLSVKGLRGGHSGLEINKYRGNSIKIINRVLAELGEIGVRLSKIEGGNKHNAIPREADALVFVPAKIKNLVTETVQKIEAVIKAEYASIDPDLIITIKDAKATKTTRIMKKSAQRNLCRLLTALPHGVVKMSADLPGLVETSTNVAIIATDKSGVKITTSQRSSVASEIDDIVNTVAAVCELAGAKYRTTDGYPGWKPNMQSPILKTSVDTYRSLYGKEPHITAIHAGLECGVIGEKYPGMDMISFGPTMEGVHSPDEKLYIDSVEKFWNFTVALLKNIS